MRNTLAVFLVLTCALAMSGVLGSPSAQGRSQVVDAVLATVGEDVILLSDVMNEIGPALYELRQEGLSPGEMAQREEALMREALDQAIQNTLLVREARRAGMEVSDREVDQRLEELRARYPSEEAFREDLQASGETLSEIRSRLRRQILAINVGMSRRREFEQNAVVTESEVAQYYQDNIEEFQRPERVRVRQIFVAAETDEAQEQASARLEQLREELEGGADFHELAAEHSEAPGAEQGGLIGWQQRGDLVDPLDSAAFSLEAGEISEVLETSFGVHILKVDEREDADVASLDEVRSQIEPRLRGKKAEERFDRWIANLRRRAGVRVFFDEHL